jgi:Bacterioferritin-associated ferredoxin
MYVCICHGITDQQIREFFSGGDKTLFDLRRELKVGTQCGRCNCAARSLAQRLYTIAEPKTDTMPSSSTNDNTDSSRAA